LRYTGWQHAQSGQPQTTDGKLFELSGLERLGRSVLCFDVETTGLSYTRWVICAGVESLDGLVKFECIENEQRKNGERKRERNFWQKG
jgi:hypothetical protein